MVERINKLLYTFHWQYMIIPATATPAIYNPLEMASSEAPLPIQWICLGMQWPLHMVFVKSCIYIAQHAHMPVGSLSSSPWTWTAPGLGPCCFCHSEGVSAIWRKTQRSVQTTAYMDIQTFRTTSTNASFTPVFVFALVSINNVPILRAKASPSFLVTSLTPEVSLSHLFPTMIFMTSRLEEYVSNSVNHSWRCSNVCRFDTSYTFKRSAIERSGGVRNRSEKSEDSHQISYRELPLALHDNS